jgi:hypothetical protein
MSRLSFWGLVPAGFYTVAAIWVLWTDRTRVTCGWISLNGMSSFLATLPVSAFFEAILGYKLDYKSNADMGLAIGLCAALVYLLGAGLGFLYSRISS